MTKTLLGCEMSVEIVVEEGFTDEEIKRMIREMKEEAGFSTNQITAVIKELQFRGLLKKKTVKKFVVEVKP